MNDNNLPDPASAASDTQPEIAGESPQPAIPVPAAATTSPGWQNSLTLPAVVTPEVIDAILNHRLQEYALAVKKQLAQPALTLPLSVSVDAIATLDIHDPVVVYLYQMREEAQRPAPLVPLQPQRKAKNPRASANISIGQMRKAAVENGEWKEGEPLPDTLIEAMIQQNGLYLPDGTVPPGIRAKLQNGEKLTPEDITLLVQSAGMR